MVWKRRRLIKIMQATLELLPCKLWHAREKEKSWTHQSLGIMAHAHWCASYLLLFIVEISNQLLSIPTQATNIWWIIATNSHEVMQTRSGRPIYIDLGKPNPGREAITDDFLFFLSFLHFRGMHILQEVLDLFSQHLRGISFFLFRFHVRHSNFPAKVV